MYSVLELAFTVNLGTTRVYHGSIALQGRFPLNTGEFKIYLGFFYFLQLFLWDDGLSWPICGYYRVES